MYSCGSNINHVMISPAYSDSLDLVKKFYNFLASDEGLAIYARSSGGFTLPFDISDSVKAASDAVANDYVKSSESIKQSCQVAPWPMYSSRLFSVGNMPVNPVIEMGYGFPELILSLDKGYKNAGTIYSENYRNAVNKWSSFMTTAGLG